MQPHPTNQTKEEDMKRDQNPPEKAIDGAAEVGDEWLAAVAADAGGGG